MKVKYVLDAADYFLLAEGINKKAQVISADHHERRKYEDVNTTFIFQLEERNTDNVIISGSRRFY